MGPRTGGTRHKEHTLSMNTFLMMGGYALYVWSSYAITAIAMIGVYFYAKREEARKVGMLRGLVAEKVK